MKLILSVAIPLLIGFAGSFFTSNAIETWYNTLNKPFFTPPNWLFGPVWTLLYIMMGVSFYLLWKVQAFKANQQLLLLFLSQLLLNGVWSPIFFGIKNPAIALVVIALLWLNLILLILKLYQNHHTSAVLLVPYLLWVSYASLLNAAIVWLN